jgi:hypothetical protein
MESTGIQLSDVAVLNKKSALTAFGFKQHFLCGCKVRAKFGL